MRQKKFYLILHRVRSAYNVGSIFRSADGIGVDKIFVTGFTQAPSKKEYSLQSKAEKMLSKTALGADKYVAWEKVSNLAKLLEKLKKENFQIIALEQCESSIDYREFKPADKIVLIVGNEPRGIDNRILKKCDIIIEIPMRGKKQSLNVAVALGVAGYKLTEE